MDKVALEGDLYELKNLLETGTSVNDLTAAAQENEQKYFIVKKHGNIIVTTKDKAINKAITNANKYDGYFVLVSNKEKDFFECLSKYRKRETIESFFYRGKQHIDGTSNITLGLYEFRRLIVALCYYEYFYGEVQKLKRLLFKEIYQNKLTGNELEIAKKLKTWIDNTPLYLQLQWFDVNKHAKIFTKLRNLRWNSEAIACDALYLKKRCP